MNTPVDGKSPMMVLPMAKEVPAGAGTFRLPAVDQCFVLGRVTTKVGQVPSVGSELFTKDLYGHFLVRWNIGRDHFTVEPGLYALGDPTVDSPVLVTANYKMTFDLLRRTLVGRHVWILVLDTKGINVWCAAGKGTFGTEEMLDRIQASRLGEVVSHRQLIVPQLGAPGLAAFEIKKHAGFRVSYGPVMMEDLPEFLDNGYQATAKMRIKKFPFKERLVLIPVELMQGLQQGIWLIAFFMLLGGLVGDGPFVQAAFINGLPPSLAVLVGIAAGNVVTPLLLPWIPGRAFSIKGAISGLVVFFIVFAASGIWAMDYSWPAGLSWLLITLAVSSWFGMAFTGASTFTSLNGVRKEMLRAMPAQFIGIVAGVILWAVSVWSG